MLHTLVSTGVSISSCLFFLLQKVLEMKREDYERLPGWKQVNVKKAKGLF